MNDAALACDTQDIVVDELFPHAPEIIWKTLTTGDLIGRWMMAPSLASASLSIPRPPARGTAPFPARCWK
jgi:uncharacterized protein YndB with AHSA1/START domain